MPVMRYCVLCSLIAPMPGIGWPIWVSAVMQIAERPHNVRRRRRRQCIHGIAIVIHVKLQPPIGKGSITQCTHCTHLTRHLARYDLLVIALRLEMVDLHHLNFPERWVDMANASMYGCNLIKLVELA